MTKRTSNTGTMGTNNLLQLSAAALLGVLLRKFFKGRAKSICTVRTTVL